MTLLQSCIFFGVLDGQFLMCYSDYGKSKFLSYTYRLGVDVLNKGLGGACLCEPEMGDFIAQEEWDFTTLELGVNMRGIFTDEEFEQRAKYLISEIVNKNPDKPVVPLPIYPNYADFSLDKSSRSFTPI